MQTSLTAESMLNLVTKFSENTTVCIVASQAVMVVLTVFGGGVFIPWNKTPRYWVWLQEMSVFTQASRAAIEHVSDHINYKCVLNSQGNCVGPLGDYFPCDYSESNGYSCYVKGRTVMQVLQGTAPSDSPWTSFGYMVLIFAVCRLGILFFLYVPFERVVFTIKNWWSAGIANKIIANTINLRLVQGQVRALLASLRKTKDMKPVRAQSTRLIATGYRHDYSYMFEEVPPETPCNVFTAEGAAASKRPTCLSWSNLNVVLKKKGTKLIDDVSGIARSGRVLALMGPSGAGKTTLLNALGNRAPYADVTGDIKFGRRPFSSADLVFVPQFDEVNANLTVFEQVELVGLMKCVDIPQMRKRLVHLMKILGLSSKMKVLCSELTGGELKRVSVGMGMVANPNVLFLDEPTTGLDSSAAFSIVTFLVELAYNTDVSVIMTIHQPSEMVFDMLQDLLLLEGGKLAYFGPLHATQRYFASLSFHCPPNTNPADFYLDLVYKPPIGFDGTTTWKDLYNRSLFSVNINRAKEEFIGSCSVAGPPAKSPNDFVRFAILVQFFLKYYSREIGLYYLRVLFLIIIAFFIGTLFLLLDTETKQLPQYSGAIFFNIWSVLFSAVAATGLFAADRRLAVEQVKNAIFTPKIYCLAQFVVSIPFNFVASLVFQVMFHWLTNINPSGESFIYAVLLTCGHLLLMEAIMLTVVEVLKNAMLCVTFAMVVLGYLFLFSGFFISVKNMPDWISWVSYITPTKVIIIDPLYYW